MLSFIIAIIALLLALYVGFKRKVISKTHKYQYLYSLSEYETINMLIEEADVRGIYVNKVKTTSILGKDKEKIYVKFVFYGGREYKIIKL